MIKTSLLKSICSALVTATLFYVVHAFFQNFLRKKKKKLEIEMEIDVLKINHCFSFGIEKVKCSHKGLACDNLECNIGKLCYLLKLVKESKDTLDVCIYILSANIFGDAIMEAHRRGVKVRIIADTTNILRRDSWINKFLKEGIAVRQELSKYLMHHKFIIIDEKIIINGSMNFTKTGAFTNWESVFISTQPKLVKQFVNGFQSLWDSFDPYKLK